MFSLFWCTDCKRQWNDGQKGQKLQIQHPVLGHRSPDQNRLGRAHRSPRKAQCKNELVFTWDSSDRQEEV